MSSYANKGTRLGLIYTAALLIFSGIFVLVMVFTNTGQDDVKTAASGPDLPLVELTGEWTSVSNEPKIEAEVKDDTIMMRFVEGDTAMNYWYGTFKAAESDGATIVSDKLETDRVVLSDAESKDFVFNDGELSFELEVMGVIRTVVLTRG